MRRLGIGSLVWWLDAPKRPADQVQAQAEQYKELRAAGAPWRACLHDRLPGMTEFVHRIIATRTVDGKTEYRTKGDANESPDSCWVKVSGSTSCSSTSGGS